MPRTCAICGERDAEAIVAWEVNEETRGVPGCRTCVPAVRREKVSHASPFAVPAPGGSLERVRMLVGAVRGKPGITRPELAELFCVPPGYRVGQSALNREVYDRFAAALNNAVRAGWLERAKHGRINCYHLGTKELS
jgi:hypothetical protein